MKHKNCGDNVILVDGFYWCTGCQFRVAPGSVFDKDMANGKKIKTAGEEAGLPHPKDMFGNIIFLKLDEDTIKKLQLAFVEYTLRWYGPQVER